jgi:hypothetical protein
LTVTGIIWYNKYNELNFLRGVKVTKKELLEVLNEFDDDTEIITTSSNYELKGNYVKAHALRGNYKEVMEQFRDDFDNEYYATSVYKHDLNAKEVIIITG